MSRTVVLIPGLAADARMWRQQVDALAPHWPVVVSQAHQGCDSITAMAAAVLDSHPGELVLCGASMGGMVALEAVRQAPSRLRGLALLGTVAHPETAEMHALRSAAVTQFAQGQAERLIRDNVAMAFHPDHAADPALVRCYLDMVLGAGVETLIRQNRAVMARPDARAHLSDIACPVLVLCGAQDQLTPPVFAQEIAVAIGHHARHAAIERCGHMLTMEQPQAVNRLLLDWLATL